MPECRCHLMPPGFQMIHGFATSYQANRMLPFEQRTVLLFGKTHPVPRLTVWMGEASYSYSGITHGPAAVPSWLEQLKAEITMRTGCHFNSVLANYYRDGQDSVAWHSDDEPELGYQPVIASVSLGATRRFAIKQREGGQRWDVDLEHGDLLIMSGDSQKHYLHAVPKTARPVGPRLNLTFRFIYG